MDDMDDDDDCGQCLMLSTPEMDAAKAALQFGARSGGQLRLGPLASQPAGKAKAKPKPQARAVKSRLPQVAASAARKDTMKLYNAVMASCKSSLEQGEDLLKRAVAEYECCLEDAAERDPSVKTIQLRLECMQLLSNQKSCRPTAAFSASVLATLRQDPFFNEQGWLPEAVQSLGQVTYTRSVIFDLMRSAEAVDEAARLHKDSLLILQTVSTALLREVSQWQANLQAYKKAKQLEMRAQEREEKRRKAAEQKKKNAEDARRPKRWLTKKLDEPKRRRRRRLRRGLMATMERTELPSDAARLEPGLMSLSPVTCKSSDQQQWAALIESMNSTF